MPLRIDGERLQRTLLLILILTLFLLIPLRIIGYGYSPGDDALRHTAFAVDDRPWGDVVVLNPMIRPDVDGHAGWHAFLKTVHRATGWDAGKLVMLSIVLAYLTFTLTGLAASGSPPAWFLAWTIMSVIEPALFHKLLLGRPLFFTMASVAILLFIWTRDRPLQTRVELAIVFLILAVNVTMHTSSWYLWTIAIPPLVACRRWRSLVVFLFALVAAIVTAALLVGWYDALYAPLLYVYLGVLRAGTWATNLVTELQPSGGPFIGLLVVAAVLALKCSFGARLRNELLQVDLCFVALSWVLALMVVRFWSDWGLPAMAVWFTRQLRDGLKISMAGLPRASDSAAVFGIAAAVLYLGQTADVGGQYTGSLRSSLLSAPITDFAPELPDEGGVLYSTEMGVFFAIYHRMPQLKFRFALAFEPGIMDPEDLRTLRAIQSYGQLRDYKPWFEKMKPADRVLVRWSSKPEWPGLEFKPFYGLWMGRKVPP